LSCQYPLFLSYTVQSDAEAGNSTMYARVDKINVLGENFLETNRADTSYFKWTIPKNNVFNDLLGRNLTPGSSYAVADGYWVNLSNLEKGSHVIEFGGNFFGGAFIQENTYHLTIE
jgi:hypothetical protein